MANAQLREEGVDRAYLNSVAAARVSQARRFDMVLPVRPYQWKCCKSLNDLLASLGSGKPLQEFLQH